MPYLLGISFVVGVVLTYGLLARPALKRAAEHQADLEAAKNLLDDAQQERATLKQEMADVQYKMGELEKDLAFERSKK
jgi:predicted  nucleic acid-binding Zn-ribbon protein